MGIWRFARLRKVPLLLTAAKRRFPTPLEESWQKRKFCFVASATRNAAVVCGRAKRKFRFVSSAANRLACVGA